jgi:hypothetical protein
MRLVNLSLLPALLAGFSIVAHADLQPAPDPEIAIDAGRFSSPIALTSTCPVNSTGGGICDFFNNFTHTITLLAFEASVSVPGLMTGEDELSYGPFTCDPTTVFETCLITFVTGSPTDTLFISFLGTNATDPGLAPGEHFEVNLNNNNSPPPDIGGWGTVDAKTFGTFAIDTTAGPVVIPEPSMMWLLAAGCLLIFAARRLRSLNLQR